MRLTKAEFMWHVFPWLASLGLFSLLHFIMRVDIWVTWVIGISSFVGMKILAYYKFKEESQLNDVKVKMD